MRHISDTLIDVYYNRFVNRTDVYNEQWATQTQHGYRAVYEPVTPSLIAQHIAGQITLSFPTLSKDAMCKWCCWDSDRADGKLDHLQSLLSQHGWIVVREGRRPGRDGHLWMFFDQPVSAIDVIRLAAIFQKAAGIAEGELEFFPKQASASKIGSAVRGPLGVNRKPEAQGMRGWFDDAPKDALAQLEWLSAQTPNQAAMLAQLAQELRMRELANRRLPARAFREQEQRKNNQIRSNQSILALVENTRLLGKEHVAQCPLCAIEGHDKHRDNLHISLDGTKFCCVYGGPGQVHNAQDIINALQHRNRI